MIPKIHTDTLLASLSGVGALAAFRWDELLHGGLQSFVTAGCGAAAIILVNYAAKRCGIIRSTRKPPKP